MLKILAQQSSTFNTAHLPKYVGSFNLIILSKPKCIVILTGFCSIVANGTSHFYSFFPSVVLPGVDFWYDN